MMPPALKKLWVPREEWGARLANKPNAYRAMKPEIIVIHHTWKPSAKYFRGAETIRGIQNDHMDVREWVDIGYHALISPDGSQIFEGRPWRVQGAHCGTVPKRSRRIFGNGLSMGICCIGNYDEETPDYRMVLTLQNLIDWLVSEFKMDREKVFGHFQASVPSSKTCPGKGLAEALGLGGEWEKAFPGQ